MMNGSGRKDCVTAAFFAFHIHTMGLLILTQTWDMIENNFGRVDMLLWNLFTHDHQLLFQKKIK